MYDLIIIGGGPAALSAGNYVLGKHLKFLIIYDDLGGKSGRQQRLVGQQGEEYLSGADVMHAFEQRVLQSGATLHDRVRNVTKDGDRFSVATEQHGVQQAAAVIVATGASPLMLPVPGAKEFLGQGLGYSLTTHAHLLAGKTTAVIGNTLRALRGTAEVAQTASRIYLIVPDASLLANPLAQALRDHPRIEILVNTRVKEIAGSFNVEEVVVEHEGQIRRLAVDAAFVDLGLMANSGVVRQLLDLEPGRFITVDEQNATHVAGLFAAGDVTTAFGEQTLIAIGEGARAALSAYDYILARRRTVLEPIPQS